MLQVLLELIQQLNSAVFVLMLILIISALTLYKVGYWTHKFKSHDDRVIKIEGLAEKVVQLSTKVDLIYQNTNPNYPIRAHSPLTFSPVGKKILENIKAKEIFSKYADKLMAEVEIMKPNNAYDIQRASAEVAKSKMLDLLNGEELITVKKEAFNQGLLIEDVLSVFALLLRDHILQQKSIALADVDKHDPGLKQ